MKPNFFRRYLLPGFVFQSIIIAGGYGTGRELVEFFLKYAPLGGLLGMIFVAMVVMSLVSAASFEFARVFRCYDYRSFFVQLLGKAWFLYEIGYLIAVMLIMAVIGAAAGTILDESFGISYALGVGGMMLAVGFLVFKGSSTIENLMAGWSFVLYATYAVLFLWSLRAFGPDIVTAFTTYAPEPGWIVGGFKYGVLQVSLIPAVLFTLRHISTHREAVGAGVLTGVIAMIPALLFFVAVAGQYPEIVERPVPVNHVLEVLGSPVFQLVFQIVLFGTLIETATGLIHAFNERIAGVFAAAGRPMPAAARPAVALGLVVTGALLSQFGIIALVGRGYGTVSWGFLVIYVVPLLTWGLWKIKNESARARLPGS